MQATYIQLSLAKKGNKEDLISAFFSCELFKSFEGCGQGFQVSRISNDKCVDLNECSRGHRSCNASLICRNNIGGFSCICNNGYVDDGGECVDIRHCFPVEFCVDNNVEFGNYRKNYVFRKTFDPTLNV